MATAKTTASIPTKFCESFAAVKRPSALQYSNLFWNSANATNEAVAVRILPI